MFEYFGSCQIDDGCSFKTLIPVDLPELPRIKYDFALYWHNSLRYWYIEFNEFVSLCAEKFLGVILVCPLVFGMVSVICVSVDE